MLSFLEEANVAANLFNVSIDEKINICIGNASCDMDSAIGAILLAYYSTHKNDYHHDPGNFENF